MSEYLRIVDSRLFNSIQSPSHCLSHHFHQKSSTFAYVPEDIVIHSVYAQLTFVNTLLFTDVYFVLFNNCVFILVSSAAIVLGLHNLCVCHLLFI